MEICESHNMTVHGQVPQVMEVVGLGFTVWFTSRYLIFKVISVPNFNFESINTNTGLMFVHL